MTTTEGTRTIEELLSEDEARGVTETLLPMISADDAVIHLQHRREGTTRFSNNAIAQGTFQDRLTVNLTVSFGNRTGSASLDSTDREALRSLVQRTEEAARLAPPDPEYLPSLGAQEYLAVEGYCPATAQLSEEAAAGFAREMITPAAEAGFKASGTVETYTTARAVATRNGLFAYHASTLAEIGCTTASADSSGWARDTAADVSRLDPARLAAKAIDLARRSAAPQAVPAGRYTALLMPPAGARLVLPVLAAARTTLDGLNYLSGHVGEKLAGEEITLYSDPRCPDFPYAPFDEEGVPRRPINWIEKGVFSGMMWDRWTAKTHGVEPVPGPESLCMAGTEQSLEDLIAGIDRGVLVTRVWYVRYVKLDQTLVTGMTRDGTFWIEEGRIRHPVKNLRFNDTALGMLQRTCAIGRPERCINHEALPSMFPPLVVKDWNFVGVTEF